jgi:hypothetical protein
VGGITKKQNWINMKIWKMQSEKLFNVISWVNKSLWLANKTDHFVLSLFGGHCI